MSITNITFCVDFLRICDIINTMDFGKNLKKIRDEKNLSQQEIAKKLNVAQSTIAMWEANQRTPKLGELNRLARVLNITVNRFLGQPKDRKVDIVKNEIYINGDKISDLDATDVEGIIDYIDAVKKKKGALVGAHENGAKSNHGGSFPISTYKRA